MNLLEHKSGNKQIRQEYFSNLLPTTTIRYPAGAKEICFKRICFFTTSTPSL